MQRIPALALLLVAAGPAVAQEWQVARDRFAFAGTRLSVEVDVQVPGSLRVIRSAPGSVGVASRSGDGFTSAGLADGDRLTLTAAGQGPVDYLVTVPENAWVSVTLPGGRRSQNLARGRSGSWDWEAALRPARAPVTEWVPGVAPDHAGGGWNSPLYTTFSQDVVPREIVIPDLSAVSRVEVRVEGFRFRVIAGRPLAVSEGDVARLEIRPAAPPMDLVLAVPPGTEELTLRLGGYTALLLEGRRVTTLCTPVTEQWLSDDRRWFTFTPVEGALDCGPGSIQRHGG